MERLNIAELLKDYPSGMELNCTVYDDVYFDYINEESGFIHCYIQNENFKTAISFDKNGRCKSLGKAKCVIFPKDKTTWDGFQRPFKDGDVVATLNGAQIFIFKEDAVNKDSWFSGVCYFGYDIQGKRLFKESRWQFSRHATEEEKQKLFDAIKTNGYKWNAETKTLEKLGKEKFDITTLKPFDSRVLVREGKTDVWRPTFYGFFHKRNKRFYTTMCGTWLMCIPYNEDTKHLTGTTDDCDEYYKTWE